MERLVVRDRREHGGGRPLSGERNPARRIASFNHKTDSDQLQIAVWTGLSHQRRHCCRHKRAQGMQGSRKRKQLPGFDMVRTKNASSQHSIPACKRCDAPKEAVGAADKNAIFGQRALFRSQNLCHLGRAHRILQDLDCPARRSSSPFRRIG